jgi:dihydrofolate synthase / folylpolyglutamate synthase
MDYKEAMEYIHGIQKFGSKLGLDRIRMLLAYMGNPQKKLKFIHVGGTNGKGSTVSFISSILMEAGYRVGIYTSPSIHRFSERIRINDSEISELNITKIAEGIKSITELIIHNGSERPTEFEVVTAMAFQYFYEQNCDFVVLEVGLGGRLDSTNIIDTSEVSVITTINYDHMDVLGDTLPKIAYEKAGIIKRNGNVVLYPQEKEVEKVFEVSCEELGAVLHKVDFSTIIPHSSDVLNQEFDFEVYKSLEISLLGAHQINNAVVAIKTIEVLKSKGYGITEDNLRKGLEKTKWAGRLEIVNEQPLFLIDGAHNIEGAKTLAYNLSSLFPGKKITFIVGVLADKDYKSMMENVMHIAERFITVTPKSARALSSQDLELHLKSYGMNVINGGEIKKAISIALTLGADDDIICSFGSLYYIGEVREYFGFR